MCHAVGRVAETASSSAVPDVLAPGLRCVFCGINPGRFSDAAHAHFANPRNDFWRLLHDAGFTPRLYEPTEQFELLRSATASRTPPTGRRPARATSGAATSTRARLAQVAQELRPRAIAFVGKEAYRGAFGERPELGPQVRTLGSTALYVLPSTSPANAAVPYAERLRWFRALHDWLEPVPRDGGARARRRRRRPRASAPLREPGHPRRLVGDAGRRDRARRERGAGAPPRARRGDRPRGARARPGRLGAHARLPLEPRPAQPVRAVPPRPGRAARGQRRRSTSSPKASTATAGGRSTSSRRPPSGSRRAASRASCATCSSTVRRPPPSTSPSLMHVFQVIVIVHLLRRHHLGRRLDRARLRGRPRDPRPRGRAERDGDEGARPPLAPARLRLAARRRAHRRLPRRATTGARAARRSRRCSG